VAYAKKNFKEVPRQNQSRQDVHAGKQIKVEMEVEGRKRKSFTIACLSPSAACRIAKTSASKTPRSLATKKVSSRLTKNSRPMIRRFMRLATLAGGVMLAHKASREARVAVEVIMGETSTFTDVVIPAVIFTDPEVAWVRFD